MRILISIDCVDDVGLGEQKETRAFGKISV
jgi:hypothetical protein